MSNEILGTDGKPLADVVVLDPQGQPAKVETEQVKLPPELFKLMAEWGDESRTKAGEEIERMVALVEEGGYAGIHELPEADKSTDALALYLVLLFADWGAAAGVPPAMATHAIALLHTLGKM